MNPTLILNIRQTVNISKSRFGVPMVGKVANTLPIIIVVNITILSNQNFEQEKKDRDYRKKNSWDFQIPQTLKKG